MPMAKNKGFLDMFLRKGRGRAASFGGEYSVERRAGRMPALRAASFPSGYGTPAKMLGRDPAPPALHG